MGKILEFKNLNEPEKDDDDREPPKRGGTMSLVLICLILLVAVMSVIVFKDDLQKLFSASYTTQESFAPSVSASSSPSVSAAFSPTAALPSVTSSPAQTQAIVNDEIINLQKQLALESTAENQFLAYQNGFLCVNSTELVHYDSNGEKKMSYPLNMPDPVVAVNGSYIAVGSRGSREVVVLKDMKAQRKETLSSNLIAVDVTEKGDYAVVCEDDSYRSRLILKNIAGEELFVWLSAEGYITSVSFAKNGRNIAVSTLNTTDQIASEIFLFDIYATEPAARHKYTNELVLALQMTENDSILALFDEKARVFEADGSLLREYNFYEQLTSYTWDKNGNVILAFWKNGEGSISVLSSFDGTLREKTFTTPTEIELMSLCEDRIVLAFGNQIYVWSIDAALIFHTALAQDSTVENVLAFDSGNKVLAAKKTAAYILEAK